jgi:hypothetical protein
MGPGGWGMLMRAHTRACCCVSHLHGVVPQIMMWYLPILLLLNMV